MAADAVDLCTATCNRGKTALEMAVARGDPLIAALLRGEDPSAVETPPPPPPPVIIAPDECFMHHTCPPISRASPDPPPENVDRLQTLLHQTRGILRSGEFCERGHRLRGAPGDDGGRLARARVPVRAQDPAHLRAHPRLELLARAARSGRSTGTRRCATTPSPRRCAPPARWWRRWTASSPAPPRRCFARCVRPATTPARTAPCPRPGTPSARARTASALLNNVALGAAYARCVHRHSLRRVAIIDFDVHHGNGTEAVVQNTTPAAPKFQFSTPYCDGAIVGAHVPPVAGRDGPRGGVLRLRARLRQAREGVHFYPGSGPTADNRNVDGRETARRRSPPRGPRRASWTTRSPWRTPRTTAPRRGPCPGSSTSAWRGSGKRAERGAAWRRVWRGKDPARDRGVQARLDSHLRRVRRARQGRDPGTREPRREGGGLRVAHRGAVQDREHAQPGTRDFRPRGRVPHPGRRGVRVWAKRRRRTSARCSARTAKAWSAEAVPEGA